MIFYDYLYYHIYGLVSKLRRPGARESTILYITVIIFFITWPFISAITFSLFKSQKVIVMVVDLAYCLFIKYLNKKYFEKANKLKEIDRRFKNDGLLKERVGYGIVVLLFLLSFVLFFYFLSLM
jgi:hypothetical protein